MISRPSIALCCIMKNEAHNIGGLLQSVRGCFDQIHITDTGSTDNSLEFVDSINKHIDEGQPNWSGLPHIDVHHFDWVDDFSAARNYSFSHATTDYICWLDLDDLLSDNKAFIHWRDTVMHAAHYWTAKYNYAYDDKGNVVCEFIRERVVKNDFGFKWHYFVHEGLLQTDSDKKVWPNQVTTWTINHRRTAEDIKQDFNRNIKLFEKHGDNLEPRMLFYYGKELYENGKQIEAGKPLMAALKSKDLQIHDRMLSIQYAAQSAFQAKAYDQAIDLCMNGLRIIPTRAELWCIIGDVYCAQGNFQSAIFALKSAMICEPDTVGGILVSYGHAYNEYPLSQLGKVYLAQCDLERAREVIDQLEAKGYPSKELTQEYYKIKDINKLRDDLPKTTDIIVTCPPGSPVTDWDENSLKEKGHGGSETAAIEVAKWMKEKHPDRRVLVFNTRAKRDKMPSGVEYVPVQELLAYTQNVEPAVHIAWRHAHRLTKAKSYIWCHDLQCPGAEKLENYDKIIALSEFHKNYLMETQQIPESKIYLGANGITPGDFPEMVPAKDPLKVIFSSSPDRGLVEAINVVKKAREISGLDIKLDCFYGFENMRKGGQGAWADSIEAHIKAHSFVTHHGQVKKSILMQHFAGAGVWLYCNDFIETYCITALEAMYSGCWSIFRDTAALKFTMKPALEQDMCDMMQTDVPSNEGTLGIWANRLVEAILEKKWERVSIPKTQTWEKVADDFLMEFEL